MKVSKRSLIMSIAVLCVCALSLTAASFAWFSASQTATVNNFKLTVAKVSDLRVSLETPNDTNFDDDSTWLTTLDISDSLTDTINGAVSTADLTNWFTVANMENVDAASGSYSGVTDGDDYTLNTAAPTGYVKSIDVWFRANEPGDVVVSGGAFEKADDETMTNENILDAVRFGSSASGNIFANDARVSDVVTEVETPVDGFASFTANTFTAKAAAATLDDTTVEGYSGETVKYGDYFFVKTTLYFYVEGTDSQALNKNTGLTLSGDIDFSFEK